MLANGTTNKSQWTYNVAIGPKLQGQRALCVFDFVKTLEEGKVTVNPVVVHTRDGTLDLPNDTKNGFIRYTALTC